MSGNPAWIKGGPSPNPKGMAVGTHSAARSLARKIQAATRDGDELLDFALTVYRANPITMPTVAATYGIETVSLRDKQWAHDWLSDRGYGRAVQAIDLIGEQDHGTDGELIVALLKTLSPSERAMYLADAAEKPEAP